MRTLLLCALFVCSTGPQEEDGVAKLFAADRAFCQATTERGLEGWLGWFAPDAIVPTIAGELRSGPEELRAYYGSMAFPPPGFRWEPDAGALATSGDLGYTVGAWSARPPDAPPAEEGAAPGGRYLTVWKRQPDGAYRVLTDAGGSTDFRTRLEKAAGPPLEWSSVAEWFEVAESGELAFALGTWTARTEKSQHEGKFLTVWRRAEDGTWEVATETGYAH